MTSKGKSMNLAVPLRNLQPAVREVNLEDMEEAIREGAIDSVIALNAPCPAPP